MPDGVTLAKEMWRVAFEVWLPGEYTPRRKVRTYDTARAAAIQVLHAQRWPFRSRIVGVWHTSPIEWSDDRTAIEGLADDIAREEAENPPEVEP